MTASVCSLPLRLLVMYLVWAYFPSAYHGGATSRGEGDTPDAPVEAKARSRGSATAVACRAETWKLFDCLIFDVLFRGFT